jgi:hypothetical protein
MEENGLENGRLRRQMLISPPMIYDEEGVTIDFLEKLQ